MGEGPEFRKMDGTYRDHGSWALEGEREEGTWPLSKDQEKHMGKGEIRGL